MKYKFFWGGPFSNWYPARLNYKGQSFENSEQAFMWEKANHFKDNETAAKVLITPNPRDNKALGRLVKNFSNTEWEKVRFDYMYEVCLAKFTQNENLKKELFANENFVEASPVDTIWGIGMKEGQEGIEDPTNWKGLNLLGKVLEKVKLNLEK